MSARRATEPGAEKRSQAGFRARRRGRLEVVAPGHVRARCSNRHFGVLFVSVGLGIAGITALAALAQGNLDSLPLLVAFPLLFAAVGAALPTECLAIEIEPSRVHLERWVRWRKHGDWHLPRNAVRGVRIRREVYRGERGSRVTYLVSVRLDADGVPAEVPIQEPRRETEARRTGETLAHALQAPLEDALGAELRTREPDCLDRPVARQADPGSPPPEAVRRVAGLFPEVELRGPWTGRGALPVWLAAGFALGVPAVVIFPLGAFAGGGVPFLAMGSLVFLLDVAALGVFLAPVLGRHRVRIGQGSVHHELWIGSLRHRSVPADAIEQIRLDGRSLFGRALSLVSDERVLRIPGGFAAEPLEWLRRWLASQIGR